MAILKSPQISDPTRRQNDTEFLRRGPSIRARPRPQPSTSSALSCVCTIVSSDTGMPLSTAVPDATSRATSSAGAGSAGSPSLSSTDSRRRSSEAPKTQESDRTCADASDVPSRCRHEHSPLRLYRDSLQRISSIGKQSISLICKTSVLHQLPLPVTYCGRSRCAKRPEPASHPA